MTKKINAFLSESSATSNDSRQRRDEWARKKALSLAESTEIAEGDHESQCPEFRESRIPFTL
jgi:hypothetical protein